MEPECAAHDEADSSVEAFEASVGQAAGDGVQDALAVGADGAGGLDERFEPVALGPGAPAVGQFYGLVGDQVAGEDGSQFFLALVGPRQGSTACLDGCERGGFFGGEVLGFFSSAQRAPLNFGSSD